MGASNYSVPASTANETPIAKPKTWAVDFNKVETIEDLKLIFSEMEITFHPKDDAHLETMQHLLTEVTE